MGKPHVTTGAAAKELGIGRTTLLRWMHDGLVTPVFETAGGQFRWDVENLRRQLKALTAARGAALMTERASAPVKIPVVSAIVTSGLGVLISRRNDRDPPWAFIGGKVHEGESPEDAALREVKEETGLLVKVGPAGLIGERIHPKNGRHMIYMHAVPTHGTAVFVGDEDELAEVRWVSLDEADELVKPYGIYAPVHAFLTQTLT